MGQALYHPVVVRTNYLIAQFDDAKVSY